MSAISLLLCPLVAASLHATSCGLSHCRCLGWEARHTPPRCKRLARGTRPFSHVVRASWSCPGGQHVPCCDTLSARVMAMPFHWPAQGSPAWTCGTSGSGSCTGCAPQRLPVRGKVHAARAPPRHPAARRIQRRLLTLPLPDVYGMLETQLQVPTSTTHGSHRTYGQVRPGALPRTTSGQKQ